LSEARGQSQLAIVVYTPPARAVLLTAVLVWEVSLGSQLSRGPGRGGIHTRHTNIIIIIYGFRLYMCVSPPRVNPRDRELRRVAEHIIYI